MILNPGTPDARRRNPQVRAPNAGPHPRGSAYPSTLTPNWYPCRLARPPAVPPTPLGGRDAVQTFPCPKSIPGGGASCHTKWAAWPSPPRAVGQLASGRRRPPPADRSTGNRPGTGETRHAPSISTPSALATAYTPMSDRQLAVGSSTARCHSCHVGTADWSALKSGRASPRHGGLATGQSARTASPPAVAAMPDGPTGLSIEQRQRQPPWLCGPPCGRRHVGWANWRVLSVRELGTTETLRSQAVPPPSARRCRTPWWEVWYTNLAKVGLTLSDS